MISYCPEKGWFFIKLKNYVPLIPRGLAPGLFIVLIFNHLYIIKKLEI